MKKVMLLVIDGCQPDYLTAETAPRLFQLAKEMGFVKTVQCAMPSVTNVNHACILSGKWPEETKVIGNYFYEPLTQREGFIEERGYMKAQTILQRYQELGGTTALLTVKGKVLGVYGEGVDIGISAQSPDERWLERYGLARPPAIDDAEAARWIIQAAYQCIQIDDPEFVYCTTNDYVFHHAAPGTPEAREQIAILDEYMSKIAALDPTRQIYITADHGMNQKTRLVNFQLLADQAGLHCCCLPPLKDRYVENHLYQEGGMLYVYLNDPTQAAAFEEFAGRSPFVEQFLTAKEAAARYHLPQEAIGDYVLLAGPTTAFAETKEACLHTEKSRTHGSLYEREIPLWAIHPEKPAEYYHGHKDIAAYLWEDAQAME